MLLFWPKEVLDMAEEVGFEPTVPSRAQRFSRPPPSTTRPLLQFLYFDTNFRLTGIL